MRGQEPFTRRIGFVMRDQIIRIATSVLILLFVMSFTTALRAQESATSSHTAIRKRLPMDSDWKFALGHATNPEEDFGHATSYFSYLAKTGYGDGPAAPDFDDRAWRIVDLPHDWCMELPFSPEGSHSHGYKALGPGFPENSVGWYRKTFTIPEADLGRRISLEFDGVYRDSRVWVNGFFLGNEPSGYSGFSYDITDYLNYGDENVVAVRADATMEEGWFYEGAGIYRHVWLVKTSPVHVARHGTFVTTDLQRENTRAEITVRTTVMNNSNKPATFRIEERIVDGNDTEITTGSSTGLTLRPGEQQQYHSQYTVTNPKLWSLESPALHQLVTTIRADGEVLDRYGTTFGIREVRFDPDRGFFLNGEHVKILGTNLHQDHAGVGVAVPDALQEYRIRRLQAVGSNAIRTSHNPPTPELLDAADRLGMLILDEHRLMGSNRYHLDQLEALIKRDRNHPSVILWSLGNEEWAIEGNKKGIRITETMQAFARRLDSTRAFTVASSGGWDNGIGTVAEVMGYNYIFHGDIDAHHKQFPWQPAVGTEETTGSGTRGVYISAPDSGHLAPAYLEQESGAQVGWQFYDSRPFLAGLFYWTGLDYHGEANPYGWPQVNSQFGIMDLCGFPKDIFFYLKSWWGDEPVLHIAPHWNWQGREGDTIGVTVFSNCEEVELFLNEESLGKQAMPENTDLRWQVPYQPGVLEARGYRNGKTALTREVKTTGPPAGIELIPDRDRITADGRDVSVITVKVTDSDELTVPSADNEIRFTIEGEGKIIGVGNGDPSSHEPEQFVKTVETSPIGGLKELPVDNLKNRPEVAADYDDSDWIPAFSNEPEDWREYRDSLLVVRGTFTLPEITPDATVTLYPKLITKNQSIFINGHRITERSGREILSESFPLDHSLVQAGENVYAITGKRLRRPNQWDTPNRDPGLVGVVYPADQWKRKVFNGLAQVIIRSTTQAGEITLSAESSQLKPATVTIRTKPVNQNH